MADFFSNRFGKQVWLTHHAKLRLVQRGIEQSVLIDVIEEGVLLPRGEAHYLIAHNIAGRADNLICAAVLEKEALIVKTVMTHWEQEG